MCPPTPTPSPTDRGKRRTAQPGAAGTADLPAAALAATGGAAGAAAGRRSDRQQGQFRLPPGSSWRPLCRPSRHPQPRRVVRRGGPQRRCGRVAERPRRRPARRRSAPAGGGLRRSSLRDGDRLGQGVGPPRAQYDQLRSDRNQRQVHDGADAGLGAGRGCAPGGQHRNAGVPGRRGAGPDRPFDDHHSRGARSAGDHRDAGGSRCRCDGHGGQFACPGAQPGGRHPVRRRRIHQSRPRSPGFPPHDGGLLPGQGSAVHPWLRQARGHQRRRRGRTQADETGGRTRAAGGQRRAG